MPAARLIQWIGLVLEGRRQALHADLRAEHSVQYSNVTTVILLLRVRIRGQQLKSSTAPN